MCFGIFAFEVVRYIQKLNFKKKDKFLLTIVEFLCYVSVVFYTFSGIGNKFGMYALYLILFAVILSFSGLTYGNKLFQNKFVYFLGKISLPMYLCQQIMFNICEEFFPDWRIRNQLLFIMIGIFLLAIVIMICGDILKKLMLKKSNSLKLFE